MYTEDEDSWQDLIKVVKRANKAYLDSFKDSESVKKESWIQKLKKKLRINNILF